MKHSFEVLVEQMEDNAKKQRALEIAKNLRTNGMGVDETAKMTKLTVDEVLQL